MLRRISQLHGRTADVPRDHFLAGVERPREHRAAYERLQGGEPPGSVCAVRLHGNRFAACDIGQYVAADPCRIRHIPDLEGPEVRAFRRRVAQGPEARQRPPEAQLPRAPVRLRPGALRVAPDEQQPQGGGGAGVRPLHGLRRHALVQGPGAAARRHAVLGGRRHVERRLHHGRDDLREADPEGPLDDGPVGEDPGAHRQALGAGLAANRPNLHVREDHARVRRPRQGHAVFERALHIKGAAGGQGAHACDAPLQP
mmetsp:Transcript_11791/g.35035  ORF Transcript_11791/g.35035 Transcript_11791/m.35035 type:complete len:256 (-) Transcript_11791:332-1099(-)